MNRSFNTLYNIGLVAFAMLFVQVVTAQEEESTIGTEVVNVVKAYTPTISDAFKVKATPALNDSITTAKKKVTYSIFSVPVASTFTPAKGKAAVVKKTKKEKLYDNYATVGFGSYTSVLAELYSNFQISRTEDFGIFLNHNSSQGGIDGTVVDDYFYDSRLNLSYGARERDMTWRADLDAKHQVYNWYGIPEELKTINGTGNTPLFNEDFDVSHSFLTAGLNGSVSLQDSFFKKANATLRYFGDDQDSGELRAVVAPTFEFPIAGELITTKVTADYVSGSFDNAFDTVDTEINYSFLNAGINPSLVILRDDLEVTLGVEAMVSLDTEASETDFFVYPKITASYRVAGDYFIAYAGLEGGLQQNNYHDFAQENPFISPTLTIKPTDKQYDGYLGMKGKLSEALSYNLRASYTAESDKALFIHNPYSQSGNGFGANGYANGNSFSIAYDDINTVGVFAEFNFDVNANLKMKVNGQYNTYDTDSQQEAWNLPDLQASVFADYQITEKWFAGVNLFFVGERSDLVSSNDPADLLVTNTIQTLDSYFDANAHVGYRFNNRLSAFARVNNILDSNYEKWLNYEVQGLQGMVGATYKFDF
ncbi:TonB-dependent receptor [Dokdonia sp. PRO95]|uniref:TonB-dependent receptor n=1 Tax=Dokdonia sp. PRO95 TaxID=1239415 RepID=UPI00055562D9|nr:TonB-dependent receptor [Dokdonia sp. PRO95]